MAQLSPSNDATYPVALPTVTTPPVPARGRPTAVSEATWEQLALHVADAQRRSSIAYTPLRAVVQAVVRELRAGGEPWDAVYATLHAVVVPTPVVNYAMEYEMHVSRSAALVAHMHSWADVERLAEIEGGAQPG